MTAKAPNIISELQRIVSLSNEDQPIDIAISIFRRGYELGFHDAGTEKQRLAATSRHARNRKEKEVAHREWLLAQQLKLYRLNIKEYRSNKTLATYIKNNFELNVSTKTIENWLSEFGSK